jgi:hypothetical protein
MSTPDPRAQRQIVMDMVYEIVIELLPEDDKSVPIEVEKKIDTLYHALSYGLGLEADESY